MGDYRVFDSLQDVVLVVNEDLGMVYGNQAASTLLEVSARRLTSLKPVSQFMVLESPLLDPEQLKTISDSTQVNEIHFSLPSGKQGWVQITIQRQPEFFAADQAAKNRWVIYMRDVSLEKTLHDKYRAELDQKESVIDDLRAARAKLEDYSRNLEAMVETRTAELRETNTLLKTILDSLGQGILVFDESGRCLPVFSKICSTFFGRSPGGEVIDSLLSLDGEDKNAFVQWRQAVFGELLEFDELVPLAPNLLKNPEDQRRGIDRNVQLGYNAMRDDRGKIQGVVMVATDRTLEVQALREAAHEREVVRRVVRVGRNRDSFLHFVRDARMLLIQFKAWHWQRQSAVLQREEILRHLHTLKGGAASFAFAELAQASHHFEERLKDLPAEKWGGIENLIHEEAQRMHDLLDANLLSLTELLGPLEESRAEVVEIPVKVFKRWSVEFTKARTIEQLRELLRGLFNECLEKPLEPMVRCFEPGLIELAQDLGKEFAGLHVEGGELRAVEEPLRHLFATFVHAFRNSIDHGFESPADRVAHGKPAAGQIRVRFTLQNGLAVAGSSVHAVAHRMRGGRWLTIEISDDGRGIDVAKVRSKLIKLGLEREALQPDAEICQMILRAELSTAEKVTEVSGRGVGMSAILAEVKQLHGEIRVFSESGRGLRLEIQVPLAVHPVTLSLAA